MGGWLGSFGEFPVGAFDADLVQWAVFRVGMAMVVLPPIVRRVKDPQGWLPPRRPRSPVFSITPVESRYEVTTGWHVRAAIDDSGPLGDSPKDHGTPRLQVRS